MNFKEFGFQMDRLRGVYGERAFPDERVKIIFREVERISPEFFEGMVSRFIAEFRQAPMVPDFRAGVASYWSGQSREPERWDGVPKSNCRYCYGNGVLTALSNDDPTFTYAFRCNCEAGERDQRKKIPIFSGYFETKFAWEDPRKKADWLKTASQMPKTKPEVDFLEESL